MPHFASKKQYRMMMAILHGKKKGSTARGDSGPPKSVAEEYSGDSKNIPDSKGKEHKGGKWDEHKQKKHSEAKEYKNKIKEKLEQQTKKSENKPGFGVVVVDENNHVLMGRHTKTNELAFPGGSAEDGEKPEQTAARELEEESGLKIDPSKLQPLDDRTFYIKINSKDPDVYLSNTSELSDVGFKDPYSIDMSEVRDCCIPSLKSWIKSSHQDDIKKSEIIDRIHKEEDQLKLHPVFDMPIRDCLTLIANALHRHIDPHVSGLDENDVAKIPLSSYVVTIRKHKDGKKSGHIDDGGKTIHRFMGLEDNEMTKDIMSLFEWFDSKHMHKIKIISPEKLSDDTIEDGMSKMIDNYRSYNIGDIYDEMENIRQEIRQGNAVDLQQAEAKILSIFDKMEDRLLNVEKKHNSLAGRAGDEIDQIEAKLRELQSKIESINKKPSVIEAISSDNINPSKISKEFYPYLSKPMVTIKPNGHITIHFKEDWTDDEKSNFLTDLKAKTLKKKKK